MIETMFYLLASIALIIHIVGEIIDMAIDYKEIRSAFRFKKFMRKR